MCNYGKVFGENVGKQCCAFLDVPLGILTFLLFYFDSICSNYCFSYTFKNPITSAVIEEIHGVSRNCPLKAKSIHLVVHICFEKYSTKTMSIAHHSGNNVKGGKYLSKDKTLHLNLYTVTNGIESTP